MSRRGVSWLHWHETRLNVEKNPKIHCYRNLSIGSKLLASAPHHQTPTKKSSCEHKIAAILGSQTGHGEKTTTFTIAMMQLVSPLFTMATMATDRSTLFMKDKNKPKKTMTANVWRFPKQPLSPPHGFVIASISVTLSM